MQSVLCDSSAGAGHTDIPFPGSAREPGPSPLLVLHSDTIKDRTEDLAAAVENETLCSQILTLASGVQICSEVVLVW